MHRSPSGESDPKELVSVQAALKVLTWIGQSKKLHNFNLPVTNIRKI